MKTCPPPDVKALTVLELSTVKLYSISGRWEARRDPLSQIVDVRADQRILQHGRGGRNLAGKAHRQRDLQLVTEHIELGPIVVPVDIEHLAPEHDPLHLAADQLDTAAAGRPLPNPRLAEPYLVVTEAAKVSAQPPPVVHDQQVMRAIGGIDRRRVDLKTEGRDGADIVLEPGLAVLEAENAVITVVLVDLERVGRAVAEMDHDGAAIVLAPRGGGERGGQEDQTQGVRQQWGSRWVHHHGCPSREFMGCRHLRRRKFHALVINPQRITTRGAGCRLMLIVRVRIAHYNHQLLPCRETHDTATSPHPSVARNRSANAYEISSPSRVSR